MKSTSKWTNIAYIPVCKGVHFKLASTGDALTVWLKQKSEGVTSFCANEWEVHKLLEGLHSGFGYNEAMSFTSNRGLTEFIIRQWLGKLKLVKKTVGNLDAVVEIDMDDLSSLTEKLEAVHGFMLKVKSKLGDKELNEVCHELLHCAYLLEKTY